MKHTLVPDHILRRVSGIWPDDMASGGIHKLAVHPAKAERRVDALREFLVRPPVTAKVLVVGEFRYIDEDMGHGYYVKCTHGLPETLVEEERELMTVTQHTRIMARTVELLKAAQDVAGHSLSMECHDEIDAIIKEFEPCPSV